MKDLRVLKKLGLAVLLILGASVSENALAPVGIERGYLASSESGASMPSTQAVAHAFGEFRIVAANLIWLNVVDRYHHEYMEQGGAWSKNAALLPFLRMITWLDPHFVEAYDIAGTILPNLHRFDECVLFIEEGIRNNPQSWVLYYDEALMHAWYRNDARTALPYARKAYQLAQDPFYKKRMGRFVRTLEQDAATGARPVIGG